MRWPCLRGGPALGLKEGTCQPGLVCQGTVTTAVCGWISRKPHHTCPWVPFASMSLPLPALGSTGASAYPTGPRPTASQPTLCPRQPLLAALLPLPPPPALACTKLPGSQRSETSARFPLTAARSREAWHSR